jgi:hypothetical protein
MKIIVETVSPEAMRYDTLDDWYISKDQTLHFQIADVGNPLFQKIIFVHALIEQLLTEAQGIKEEQISQFDMDHPQSDEPGLEKDAPYRDAHLLAEGVERLLLSYLRIPWKEYEEALGHE